jgi:hypothetical protein
MYDLCGEPGSLVGTQQALAMEPTWIFASLPLKLSAS